MSLADVNTIRAIKIDVTPSGGSTTSREYVAANVAVQRLWIGQSWMTADFVRHVNTEARHLVFRMWGSDIDQVSNTGSERAPILLAEDLLDTDGYTVEIYPDAEQSKKFEVIAWNPGGAELARFENGARVDEDEITCITKEKVSRADVEWFRKF